MTLASILKGKVLCHFFTCYVGLKLHLRKNALRRLTIIGLEVKCAPLPKAHVLKTWSPVQECLEVGCWGGDWSRKILTFWMAWSIHGSITQEHVGPGGGRTFTWGPVRSRWLRVYCGTALGPELLPIVVFAAWLPQIGWCSSTTASCPDILNYLASGLIATKPNGQGLKPPKPQAKINLFSDTLSWVNTSDYVLSYLLFFLTLIMNWMTY